MNEIFETYKNDVEFLLVYIREAHPSDGWQTPQNLYDEVIYRQPTTDDERAEVASACQINLDLRLPMVMDSVDDDIDDKYIARPMRLYVIDGGGRISYNGHPGPAGFYPDEWEEEIKAVLGRPSAAAE